MNAQRQPVGPDDQRALLAMARRAIEAAVAGMAEPRIDEDELGADLRASHAAFVTLTERGVLRGCIGRLDPTRSLWRNVLASAIDAALGDPRFAPVEPAELDDLRIEISVLDEPVPIDDPAFFDPTIHGIIVERGIRRGLLLPKVAQEHHWSARETLETACHKAGLPHDAWRDPETTLSVFRAFVFAEPDDAGMAVAVRRQTSGREALQAR